MGGGAVIDFNLTYTRLDGMYDYDSYIRSHGAPADLYRLLTDTNIPYLEFSKLFGTEETTIYIKDCDIYKTSSSGVESQVFNKYTLSFNYPSGTFGDYEGLTNDYSEYSQTVKYPDYSASYYRLYIPEQIVEVNGREYTLNEYEMYLYKNSGTYLAIVDLWKIKSISFTANSSGGYTSENTIEANAYGGSSFNLIISTDSTGETMTFTPMYSGIVPSNATEYAIWIDLVSGRGGSDELFDIELISDSYKFVIDLASGTPQTINFSDHDQFGLGGRSYSTYNNFNDLINTTYDKDITLSYSYIAE